MPGQIARALVVALPLVAFATRAEDPRLAAFAEKMDAATIGCEGSLKITSTYIPDADTILREPGLLENMEHGRIILAGWILEELTEAAKDPHAASAVNQFRSSLKRAMTKPEDERRVRIDNQSYARELSNTGLDRANSSTKLLALAQHYAAERPIILSADIFLVAQAQSMEIAAELYDVSNPLTDAKASDLIPLAITDAEMKIFEDTGVLPPPPAYVQPNQFVRYSSPGRLGGNHTVGRYIYERPKLIKGPITYADGRLSLPKDQLRAEFIETLRIKVNGDEVPRADVNPDQDGGWVYDHDGGVTFVGKRYVPNVKAKIEVFIQQRPHRVQALQTYAQMGVEGQEMSFEQLILMNVMTDPSIDIVIVVGVAGASKTYSAVTAALWAQKMFSKLKVIVTRVPAHVGARDPGTEPGTLKQKEMSWLGAILGNLSQILKKDSKDLPPGWENQSFAYLRGMSLTDCLVIFDEAQNSTKELMKTMITRIGNGARIFVLGDVTQTDGNETLRLSATQNGLAAAAALFRMPNLTAEEKSRVAIVYMRHSNRSELVRMTTRIFDQEGALHP